MPRDPREFQIGDRVPGTKWVVRGTLGEGGMGVVLDVVKEPGIAGAMKVMLPAFAKRREFVDRFFGEVRLLAQLRHPNIVQVFDYDQLDDGTPYVVMERLFGVTLRAGLRNLRAKGTPISAKLTYEVTRQLCEGLFRAHSNTPAIVHRDVKPENTFFHQPDFADAVVKVIDFGIAAVLDGTRDRRVFGTPRHMAPEQIRAQPVSPATDVYATALVLYEMLTGRFPWDVDLRNELALVEAHLHRPPVPPSTYARWVPPRVDKWVLRALSKDAKARPQDAYEFISKLYELQFVNDGTSDSVVDINTTAPTLARLAEAVEQAADPRPSSNGSVATHRARMAPRVKGPSLEAASPELFADLTDPASAPPFSAQTMERGALATTHVPSGADREAATRTAVPWTKPVPKSNTPVLLPLTTEPCAPSETVEPELAPAGGEIPLTSAASPRLPIAVSRARGAALRRRRIASTALGAGLLAGFLVLLSSLRPGGMPRPPVPGAPEARWAGPSSPSSVVAPSPVALETDESRKPPARISLPPSLPSPTPAEVAEAPDREAKPPPASASSNSPPRLPARRAARAAANPSALAHEPDDGRDLLYVAP